MGHISDREELSNFYNWADLMLHPSCQDSTGDQEGLPSSIVEAFSTGIAVVLSDHVGLRQIFSGAGIYTDPHDEKLVEIMKVFIIHRKSCRFSKNFPNLHQNFF